MVVVVLTAAKAVVVDPLTVAARWLAISIGHLVAAEEVIADRTVPLQQRLPLQTNATLALIALMAATSLSRTL